jgi:hypothetical protein
MAQVRQRNLFAAENPLVDLCTEINIPDTIFDGDRVDLGKALPYVTAKKK